jgi:hypothetical protein
MNVLGANCGRTLVALLVLLGTMAGPGVASAQETGSLTEKIGECMGHYVYGRFDEGINLANDLLKRAGFRKSDRV